MVFETPGQPLRLEDRPPAEPGAGQLRLAVRACGVCRTDLHIVDGELHPPRLPVVPGHEIVGLVEELGPGVAGFTVGERVGVPWLGWTCGECAECRRGRENLCARARFTGFSLDGGYAATAVADHRYCFPLPAGYDDVHAAPLLCAGLIGARSLRLAGDAERLGIYGFGAAGHLVAQVARAEGRRVFAFTRPGDLEAQRFAAELGVEWAGGSDQPAPEKLDAAILFAPVGALVPAALAAVAPGGTVVCGGIHMSDIPSFPYSLLWQERQLRSVANLTRADATALLDVAARVTLRVETESYPLAEANTALAALRSGRVRGAAVLLCSVLALAAAGCGATPEVVSRAVERGATTSPAAAEARAEAERLWPERLDESKLRAALAAWKRAIALDDADASSYAMAARASYLLADGFLALDGRAAEMKQTFGEGATLAERGLRALSRDFERRRAAGGDVDVAAVGLGKAAVPLLYFWGQNVIRWADAEGRMTAMRVYRQVFNVMEQVRVLDPGFDHGGADRFFGAARAESPAIAGGSLPASRDYFGRALAIAPTYLETHLDLAKHYARRAGDAQLYAQSLRVVMETPSASVPDAVPEQEIAKKKARQLPLSLP